MQPITLAKMVPLDKSTQVALPIEFIKNTAGEANSAILILAPHSKIIHLIPTRNSIGVKVVVETTELSSDFLLEIEQFFSRNKLKPLYRTGLCFTKESCKYEGYFDLSEVLIAENQLKEEISKLKGVNNVELTKLQP